MFKIVPLLFFIFAFSSFATDNLDMGEPGGKGQIIDREAYAIKYSEELEQPLWVSYRLTKEELENPRCERRDNFRADPLVKTCSAILKDYRGSGYDRGHLAPAADMKWSEEAMSESFFLSNMSPQHPDLNRGQWAKKEGMIRNLARIEGELYIVTGPVIKPGYKTIGPNKVAVPSAYYKIVYAPLQQKVLAFIMPNSKITKPFESYVVSVDYIERITGLDFLSNLDDAIENKLEKKTDLSLWAISESQRRSAYLIASMKNKKEVDKGHKEARSMSTSGRYSISASGKRHNSHCRYFKKSQSTNRKNGIACKICGG